MIPDTLKEAWLTVSQTFRVLDKLSGHSFL